MWKNQQEALEGDGHKFSCDGTKLANHHSFLRECQGQVCRLSFNASVGLEARRTVSVSSNLSSRHGSPYVGFSICCSGSRTKSSFANWIADSLRVVLLRSTSFRWLGACLCKTPPIPMVCRPDLAWRLQPSDRSEVKRSICPEANSCRCTQRRKPAETCRHS